MPHPPSFCPSELGSLGASGNFQSFPEGQGVGLAWRKSGGRRHLSAESQAPGGRVAEGTSWRGWLKRMSPLDQNRLPLRPKPHRGLLLPPSFSPRICPECYMRDQADRAPACLERMISWPVGDAEAPDDEADDFTWWEGDFSGGGGGGGTRPDDGTGVDGVALGVQDVKWGKGGGISDSLMRYRKSS